MPVRPGSASPVAMRLEVEGQFALSLDEIRTTWQAPIPAAMAAAGH